MSLLVSVIVSLLVSVLMPYCSFFLFIDVTRAHIQAQIVLNHDIINISSRREIGR